MADNKNTQPAQNPNSFRRGPGHGPGGGGHGMRMVPGEKARDFKGTTKRLLKYLKPYWPTLLLVVFMTVLAAVFNSLGPRVLGNVTNELSVKLTTGGAIDFTKVRNLLLLLAGIYLLNSGFRYAEQFFMAGVSQKTMYDMRASVDKKLRKLPLKYYDAHPYGDILSRVTNDVDTVSNSLQTSLLQILSSLTRIISILVMMLSISPVLTLIAILTVPPSAFLAKTIVVRSQELFRGQSRTLGQLNGYVEEMYSGHTIIKAFSREDDTIKEFGEINQRLYNYGWKSQFISAITMPMTSFMGNVGYVLVAVVGGLYAISGRLLIGDIQAFVQYLRNFSMPITETANIANVLQSTMAAAERIFELLDEEEEVPDLKDAVPFPEAKGTVEFDHIRFGYDESRTIIRDLSLKVEAGDKIAIVGPTGAGKTTLVNLVLRFYDVNGGHIRVDGRDVREMTRYDLRSKIGMVLQDTWLFKGTIMENIRYGRLGATDEEVIAAAKGAFADHFIRQLPGGYQFELKEDASNISQGQRQLLTIARAILSDPQILILDEATSSVDTRTELLIQKAMDNLMEHRTSFIIAHRLSTIKDASTILVMDHGDIVETGDHPSLLAKGGFYAKLYQSQFANAEEEPVA